MIHELKDPAKAEHLFAGWEETLIWSCLQGVMGSVFVTDPDHPVSALAFVGCFGFYAGEPDRELVENKPGVGGADRSMLAFREAGDPLRDPEGHAL